MQNPFASHACAISSDTAFTENSFKMWFWGQIQVLTPAEQALSYLATHPEPT